MKTTMKTNETTETDKRNYETDNETTKQIDENNKTDKQELAVGGVAVREGARAQGGHQSLRLLLAVVLHQQTSWLSTKHDHCHRVGRLVTYVVMWVSIFQSK